MSSSKHLATPPPIPATQHEASISTAPPPRDSRTTQTAGLSRPPASACAEMCAVSTLVLSDRRRRRRAGGGATVPCVCVVGLRIDYIYSNLVLHGLPNSGGQTGSSFGEHEKTGPGPTSQSACHSLSLTARPNSHGSCHVRTHRSGNRHPPPPPESVLVSMHCNRSSQCTRPTKCLSPPPWQAKRPARRGHDLICLGTFLFCAIPSSHPHHNHITHTHPSTHKHKVRHRHKHAHSTRPAPPPAAAPSAQIGPKHPGTLRCEPVGKLMGAVGWDPLLKSGRKFSAGGKACVCVCVRERGARAERDWMID